METVERMLGMKMANKPLSKKRIWQFIKNVEGDDAHPLWCWDIPMYGKHEEIGRITAAYVEETNRRQEERGTSVKLEFDQCDCDNCRGSIRWRVHNYPNPNSVREFTIKYRGDWERAKWFMLNRIVLYDCISSEIKRVRPFRRQFDYLLRWLTDLLVQVSEVNYNDFK